MKPADSTRRRTFVMSALILLLSAVPAPSVHADMGGSGTLYSLEHGELSRYDAALGAWRNLNTALPVKVVYPFTEDLRDPVFSYGFDPLRPGHLAVTTPRGIYVSRDQGVSFRQLPTADTISVNIHFTSVALSPFDEQRFLAGTSFDGLYETTNGGKNWRSLTEKSRFLHQGIGFYEEISAVAYDPELPDSLYLGAGFGAGLFRYDRRTESFEPIPLPPEANGADIGHLGFWNYANPLHDGPLWALEVSIGDETWLYFPSDRTWKPRASGTLVGFIPGSSSPLFAPGAITKHTDVSAEAEERRDRTRGRTGIYLSAAQVQPASLDRHIEFIKAHGMNSLVVDFKDDFGYLTYDSALTLPKAAGAVRARFRAAELVKKAHENGLYLIARIVVFKDRQLFRYDKSRYALRDRLTGEPWGDFRTVKDAETGEEKQVQLEFWVDPHAEDVWRYNIEIARELEELGVDEIQFDYIRFPSDGDVSKIEAPYRKEGMTRVNALESFLSLARSVLSVPIGTDVYGFNAWFRMKYIGQDIDVFSRYVDVISPMFYPSHFPGSFLGHLKYLPRAEHIYRVGTDRAVSIVDGRCVIRSYVQSFLIGGELKFEKPTYTAYLDHQLEGLAASGGSGFTLWNASGRYYMVTPGLARYARGLSVPADTGETTDILE